MMPGKPRDTPPACSVIILNYNGRQFLEPCLRSVLEQEHGNLEVIVVDNGSSDGSPELVREIFPAVRVIEAGANLGFAGGNNLGVRCATHDRVVLLNNDTVARPGWLARLLEPLADPGTAIASSLVLTRGVPEQYYARNGSVNFLGHNVMLAFHVPEHIFYCNGASLAFKRELLGEPFDPDFFAYAEDLYLGFRARFAGFHAVHAGQSVVDHLGGATSRTTSPARIAMLQERNRLLNLLLFFSPWTLVRIAPYILLNAVLKVAGGLAGRFSLRGVLAAYGWFFAHIGSIPGKRAALRAERRAGDAEVISWMSGRLTNGETPLLRFADRLSLGYCRLVRLRTLEFFPPETR